MAGNPRSEGGDVKNTNVEVPKLGFGALAEYTYVELLGKKPGYVEFLADEGGE